MKLCRKDMQERHFFLVRHLADITLETKLSRFTGLLEKEISLKP